MRAESLKNYEERRDGYYSEGKRVTNFTVHMEALLIDIVSGQRTYRLTVRVEDMDEVTVEIPAQRLNSDRWLEKLPIANWCDDKKEFSSVFRKAVAFAVDTCESVEYLSPVTGFQKVGGKWRFLCTNGAFTESGFDHSLYSTVPHCLYNGDGCWVDEDEAMRFLELVRKEAGSVYPVFALNLLSITRDLFKDFGLDVSASLWLEGRSGSGKTTLAQVFGMFTDTYEDALDDPNGWHRRLSLSSTEKIAHVVNTLQKMHGITVIVDDIREEKTQRQREKSRAAADIVIRSVYRGFTTEKTSSGDTAVGTCAIFTGEYRENIESQNARLLILDVTEFMQNEGKRTIITEAQKHLGWQANLIGGFIRWLIRKAGEPDIGEKWRAKMNDLRARQWAYESQPNGQRLKDTIARFCFITDVFGQYLTEQFPQQQEVIGKFLRASRDSIEHSIHFTFENLGGIQAIASSVMKSILRNLIREKDIRLAKYEKERFENVMGSRWNELQFCCLSKIGTGRLEKALLIPELRRSFFGSEQDGKAVDEGPMMIMQREDFEILLQQEVKKRIQEGSLSEEDGSKITLQLLAKTGLLLVWPRCDGIARYNKDYPMVEFEIIPKEEVDDDGFYSTSESYEQEIWYVQAVCFDLRHEVFRGLLQEELRTVDVPSCLNPDDVKESLKARRTFCSGLLSIM